jgi:hypothetical protein
MNLRLLSRAFSGRPSTDSRQSRGRTRSSLRSFFLFALLGAVSACEEDPVVAEPEGGGGGEAGSSGGSPGEGGGGSSGGEGWSAPPLRLPVEAADTALARDALALMGSAAVGAEGSCRECHSIGRPTLTRWSALTRDFSAACLEDSSLGDQSEVDAIVDCFEARAEGPDAALGPSEFGIYAAAAHLPWFTFVFEHASQFGADGQAEQERFIERVGMPRAGQPWTQGEFDRVAEWFARGLPGLFELIPEDAGEDCSAGLAPRLATHLDEMAISGWRAKNEEVPLLMFGCDDGQSGIECLSALPLAGDQDFGATWDVPGAQIRILHDNSDTLSTYWSRSSADGRYIGTGLRDPGDFDYYGQILDLSGEQLIAVDFSYDATFFPDNSGFLVQRGGGSSDASPGVPSDGAASADDTAVVCEQSILAGGPASISGLEAECNSFSGQIGLYQQLAKAIDGDDYWVVHGSYESDDGGFFSVHENPSAAFDADSTATFTPMLNQGNGFETGEPTQIQTPRQGDPILSPSGRLLVTRVKGREYTTEREGFEVVAAEQSGYALSLLATTPDGDGFSAALEDVGRICMQGGKATFSYDERWLVFHHYVIPADAGDLGFPDSGAEGFSEYLDLGASNLYLVDLLTGESRRITNMDPGQYALFPHFRSDGWIYFVVRTLEGSEWLAATDAALVFEDE